MSIGDRKLVWRGDFSAYYKESMINLLYGVLTFGIHPVRAGGRAGGRAFAQLL